MRWTVVQIGGKIMSKEEAKEFIEEKNELEIRICDLEQQHIGSMTIAGLYGKLECLRALYNRHRQLSKKIKMLEHLAPKL